MFRLRVLGHDLAAIAIGAAAGLLLASLVTVVAWFGFAALTDIADPVGPATILGLLAGLLVAGYVGARAADPPLTHGALAALALGTAIAALALLSGSPAGITQIVGLLLLAAVVGTAGAAAAGRR